MGHEQSDSSKAEIEQEWLDMARAMIRARINGSLRRLRDGTYSDEDQKIAYQTGAAKLTDFLERCDMTDKDQTEPIIHLLRVCDAVEHREAVQFYRLDGMTEEDAIETVLDNRTEEIKRWARVSKVTNALLDAEDTG